MIDPYLGADGAPDRRTAGSASSIPSVLPGWVTRLDAAGLQPHFHAIGDRAVRECLDAVAAARSANGPSRHPAAHRPHPGDPPRRRRRGSPRSTSSPTPSRCGPATRTRWTTSRSRSSARSGRPGSTRSARCCGPGARLAMGSDWSVSTPNPLLEIEVAVTRRLADESRGDVASRSCPSRRLTLTEAIRGVHARIGVRQPPRRRHGLDRGRQARRPDRDRSRPVRARRRPDRRRPGARARSSAARPCSRTRRSAELERGPLDGRRDA